MNKLKISTAICMLLIPVVALVIVIRLRDTAVIKVEDPVKIGVVIYRGDDALL